LVTTFQQHSRWAGASSATALLTAAEAEFDVLITTDRNLRHQQNLVARNLAILVLPTTSWPRIQAHADRIAAGLNALRPGELIELQF
jgi:hypothetical protein